MCWHSGTGRGQLSTGQKGKFLGPRLQLCASGSPEPSLRARLPAESKTSHTQSNVRAENPCQEHRGEDRTCSIVPEDAATLSTTTQIPNRSRNTFQQWHQSCATHPHHACSSVAILPLSVNKISIQADIMLLGFFCGQVRSCASLWIVIMLEYTVLHLCYFWHLCDHPIHRAAWEFTTSKESQFPTQIIQAAAFVQVHMSWPTCISSE